MQKVNFTYSCGTRLTYELDDTQTAEIWVSLLSQMDSQFLLRSDVNHKHGFSDREEIKTRAIRLNRCAAYLGFHLEPIDRQNWHTALNNLHVNFPGFFKQKLTPEKFQTAHEMNLLIHWLEYELVNLYGGKNQYLFNLDFNHEPLAYDLKSSIPDNEFDHFSTSLEFGNLHLHYIFIGRHFLEMFNAQDFVCPPAHFRAQHAFNATCGLVFSEPQDEALSNAEMHAYYHQRGGKRFFGFEYEDPKFAKGFFRLGRLQNIAEYAQLEQREALRRKLKNSHIVDWQVLS